MALGYRVLTYVKTRLKRTTFILSVSCFPTSYSIPVVWPLFPLTLVNWYSYILWPHLEMSPFSSAEYEKTRTFHPFLPKPSARPQLHLCKWTSSPPHPRGRTLENSNVLWCVPLQYCLALRYSSEVSLSCPAISWSRSTAVTFGTLHIKAMS